MTGSAIAFLRRAALVAIVAMLAACVGPAVRPEADLLAAQKAREEAIAAQSDWQFEGRIAVSDGRDGGSGAIAWRQQGATFDIEVTAPVTGHAWRLEGGPGHAVLSGLEQGEVEGEDVDDVVARALGWHVPFTELVAWVRGVRASGSAELRFGRDGLPESLVQDGWTVRFPGFDDSVSPPRPRKVFAKRGHWSVLLAVSRWTVP